MIEFAWPWCFAFLPLPLLLRYLLPPLPQRYNAALKVPFYTEMAALQHALETSHRVPRRRGQGILLSLIWLLLVFAAARPQWLGDPVELPRSGRDLLLAVDLSGSMLEYKDMRLQGQAVDRLTAVNHVLEQFIQRRVGDRLGLVLFGSQAYLQVPLTFDRNTVQTVLNETVDQQKLAFRASRQLRKDITLTGQATAIGDAVALAIKRLRDTPNAQRVLILLTDGANTAGEVQPRKAADLAAQAGLKIYTVGVGAEQMVLQGIFGARRINPSSDLDEATLTYMAETTGGQYFRAKDKDALVRIYQELDVLEPVEKDAETFRPLQALFYWPLGIAFGLALLFGWLRLRV
jgi:Ca-activated chloride channel family protein